MLMTNEKNFKVIVVQQVVQQQQAAQQQQQPFGPGGLLGMASGMLFGNGGGFG